MVSTGEVFGSIPVAPFHFFPLSWLIPWRYHLSLISPATRAHCQFRKQHAHSVVRLVHLQGKPRSLSSTSPPTPVARPREPRVVSNGGATCCTPSTSLACGGGGGALVHGPASRLPGREPHIKPLRFTGARGCRWMASVRLLRLIASEHPFNAGRVERLSRHVQTPRAAARDRGIASEQYIP